MTIYTVCVYIIKSPPHNKKVYCIIVYLKIDKSRLEMNRNPALHNLFLLDDWHLTGQYTLQALSEKYSPCQFSLYNIYIYQSDELMGKMRHLTKLEC